MGNIKKFINITSLIYTNYLINFTSLNIFIILLYLFDLRDQVTEVALFGSFTILVCQIFSSNSRSLILSKKNVVDPIEVIIQRFIFIFPIMILSTIFIYLYEFQDISLITSILFLIISQWIFEIVLSGKEIKSKKIDKSHFILYIISLFFIIFSLYIKNFLILKVIINFITLFVFYKIFVFLKDDSNKLQLYKLDIKNWFKSFIFSSFGSSLAIATSNFLFRFFIVILNSANLSSTLIVGFMFGSLPVSLFFHIFGASIVRENFNLKFVTKIFKIIFVILLVLCFLLIYRYINIFSLTPLDSSSLLIVTASCSVIGCFPMMLGLYRRQLYIQRIVKENFFYLDMIYSFGVILIIPIIYVLGNTNYYVLSFFVTGILSSIIYFFSNIIAKQKIIKLLLFLLPIPLFLTLFNPLKKLDVSLFNSLDIDMVNHIYSLPIPISIFVLPIVILALLSKIKFQIYSIYFFIFSFFISVFSLLFMQRLTFLNVLNLVQFFLPMSALICGEVVGKLENYKNNFLKYLFYISSTIILFDIFRMIILIYKNINLDLGIFAIYKDFEYTAAILLICISLSLITFIQKNNFIKLENVITLILLSFYIIFKNSLVIYLLVSILLILILITKIKFIKINKYNYIFTGLLVIITFYIINNFRLSYSNSSEFFEIFFNHRLQSYFLFVEEIFMNIQNFLFGSNIENKLYLKVPGVFNYYFDYIYNFGFISLLPFLYLIYLTFSKTWEIRKIISNNFQNLFLFFSLGYIIFIDSTFGSSLKQPYSGVLIYFIWGLYLSVIFPTKINIKKKNNRS